MSEPVANPGAARPRTPVHLWIVAVLAILWHIVGALNYLAVELRWESFLEGSTEEQLAHLFGYPSWVVASWAIAVWGGLAASIGLVLRRSWAVWLFGLAIVGLALTTLYNFVLTDGAALMGSGQVIFTGVIWLVAIALFLYARRQAANGVLR